MLSPPVFLLELHPAGYPPLTGTRYKSEPLPDPGNGYPAGIWRISGYPLRISGYPRTDYPGTVDGYPEDYYIITVIELLSLSGGYRTP